HTLYLYIFSVPSTSFILLTWQFIEAPHFPHLKSPVSGCLALLNLFLVISSPRSLLIFKALEKVSLDTIGGRSEEHTSELQSRFDLVCRLLLEKKKKNKK